MAAPQPSRSLNSLPIVLVLTRADPIAVGVLVAAVIVVVVVTVQTGAHRCGTDGGGSITGTAPTVARIPGYWTARTTSDWRTTRSDGPTCDRGTRYWMRRPRSSGHAIAATAADTTSTHATLETTSTYATTGTYAATSTTAKSATSTTAGKCVIRNQTGSDEGERREADQTITNPHGASS